MPGDLRRGGDRCRPERTGRRQPAAGRRLVRARARGAAGRGWRGQERQRAAPRLRARHVQRVLPAGGGLAVAPGLPPRGARTRVAPRARRTRALDRTGRRAAPRPPGSPPGCSTSSSPATARRGWTPARVGPDRRPPRRRAPRAVPPIRAGTARWHACAPWAASTSSACCARQRARPGTVRRRARGCCWATPATPTSRSTPPGRADGAAVHARPDGRLPGARGGARSADAGPREPRPRQGRHDPVLRPGRAHPGGPRPGDRGHDRRRAAVRRRPRGHCRRGRPHLYGGLVPDEELPPRTVRAMRRFQLDPRRSRWTGPWTGRSWAVPPPHAPGTVHVADSVEQMTEALGQVSAGAIPAEPFLLTGQMTTADPTFPRRHGGPVGLHARAAAVPPTPARAGSAGSGTATTASASPTGCRPDREVRARVREPGPRPPGPGAARDGGQGRQPDRRRPQRRHLPAPPGADLPPGPGPGRAETPIGGLYLGSASAHPGGGVHGARA